MERAVVAIDVHAVQHLADRALKLLCEVEVDLFLRCPRLWLSKVQVLPSHPGYPKEFEMRTRDSGHKLLHTSHLSMVFLSLRAAPSVLGPQSSGSSQSPLILAFASRPTRTMLLSHALWRSAWCNNVALCSKASSPFQLSGRCADANQACHEPSDSKSHMCSLSQSTFLILSLCLLCTTIAVSWAVTVFLSSVCSPIPNLAASSSHAQLLGIATSCKSRTSQLPTAHSRSAIAWRSKVLLPLSRFHEMTSRLGLGLLLLQPPFAS